MECPHQSCSEDSGLFIYNKAERNIKHTPEKICMLHLRIPHSPQQLHPGCAGGQGVEPSSGVAHQQEVWRGMPRLPWRVLQVVLLGPPGRPSLRHLWLGRPESLLPGPLPREEAFPSPWRKQGRDEAVPFYIKDLV